MHWGCVMQCSEIRVTEIKQRLVGGAHGGEAAAPDEWVLHCSRPGTHRSLARVGEHPSEHSSLLPTAPALTHVSTQKVEVDGECPQALSYPRGRGSRVTIHLENKIILSFPAAPAGLAMATAVIHRRIKKASAEERESQIRGKKIWVFECIQKEWQEFNLKREKRGPRHRAGEEGRTTNRQAMGAPWSYTAQDRKTSHFSLPPASLLEPLPRNDHIC